QGHRWELPPLSEANDPGAPVTCPVCGARAEGVPEACSPETLSVPTAASPGGEAAAAPAAPPPTVPAGRLRCPHCDNPIHLSDAGSDEVLCPGCGGAFRVRDARHTETTAPMKTLGRFQLLERVGLGGFGAVWRARGARLDRIVA